MPVVDTHVVISDAPILLNDQTKREHLFSFDLGTWAEHTHRPILMWFRRFKEPVQDLEYQWILNNQPLRKLWGIKPDQQGTMHEVVEKGITKDGVNTLKVEILSGTGSVQIHGVVLFVRVNV